MDTTLPIEKLGIVIERHDRPVPDIRMDVEPLVAVTPE